MDTGKRKLEERLLKIPDCLDFLSNFIGSCEDIDVISNFVNYYNDLLGYCLTCKPIRQNYKALLNLFESATGLKVYYDDYEVSDFENLFGKIK